MKWHTGSITWQSLTYWCHVLTCRWTLCKKWIIIWMFHLTTFTHLRHDHHLFVTGLLAWIAVCSTDSARSPPSCTPTTGRSTTLASHSCHQTQTCRPSTDDIAHTLVALRPGNWASPHDCCREKKKNRRRADCGTTRSSYPPRLTNVCAFVRLVSW